jgi:stage II sporulation protein GA (sporulation sigma-E factor processing peptidase)
MRVIYIDSLFAFELAADFALLWAASRLSAVRFRAGRGLAAAALGAAYSAAAVFFPELACLPLKICAASAMALIAWGGEKRLWRPAAAFAAASALFAGLCLALVWAGEGPQSFRTLLIALGLTLGLCAVPLRFIGARRAASRPVRVRLKNRGRSVELSALPDTGNRLREPVSGGAVLVAAEEELAELLEPEARRLLLQTRGLGAADRLLKLGGGFRLVPYDAVGVSGGLLLAFRPEAVYIDGEKRTDIWAALSPTEIGRGDDAEYAAIINGDAV